MTGAVKTIITCEPAAESATPCPAGTAPVVTSAYLLDASAQHQVEAAFSPVDYASASSFGMIAFCPLIGLWVFTQLFKGPIRAINRN